MAEREYRITYEDGSSDSTHAETIDSALRQANNAGDELELIHDIQRKRVVRIEEVGQ